MSNLLYGDHKFETEFDFREGCVMQKVLKVLREYQRKVKSGIIIPAKRAKSPSASATL